MRNLKKVLSLVLCLAMMLSVMVVGAGAAFTDQDAIDPIHAEAVDACVALNIITGYPEGDYQPNGEVTRAQMCKMICIALNGGKEPVLGESNAPTFTDTKGHWAEAYIESCVSQGIVAGMGDGKFNPEGKVTATQAAKMLLIALGYDADHQKYLGDSWAINVNTDASAKGLYVDLTDIDANAPLTREHAAQMIWNALNAYVVEYKTTLVADENGQLTTKVTVTDKVVANTNDKITLLKDEYDVDKLEGVVVANEYADLNNNASSLKEGKTQLNVTAVNDVDITAGSFYDGIYDISSDMDLLGQSVILFAKDKKTVVGAVSSSEDNVIVYTFEDKSVSDLKDMLDDEDLKVDATTLYSANYGSVATGTLAANPAGTGLVAIDNNDDGIVEYLIQVSYQFGEVTKYSTSDKGSITVKTGAGKLTYNNAEDVAGFDDVAKDDYVIVTEIGGTLYINKADTVVGELTAYKTNKSLTVDGTKYNVSGNAGVDYNVDTDEFKNANTYGSNSTLNKEATFYLDNHGYVVAVGSVVGASDDFAFVWGIDQGKFNGDYEVKVTLSDGTTGEYILNDKAGSIGATMTGTGSSATYTSSKAAYGATTEGTAETGITPVENLYTYSINSSDEITLEEIASAKISTFSNKSFDFNKNKATIKADTATLYGNSETVFFNVEYKADGSTIDKVNVYTGIAAAPSINMDGTAAATQIDSILVKTSATGTTAAAAVTFDAVESANGDYLYLYGYQGTNNDGAFYRAVLGDKLMNNTDGNDFIYTDDNTQYADGVYEYTVTADGLYQIKSAPENMVAGIISTKTGNSIIVNGMEYTTNASTIVANIDGDDTFVGDSLSKGDAVILVYDESGDDYIVTGAYILAAAAPESASDTGSDTAIKAWDDGLYTAATNAAIGAGTGLVGITQNQLDDGSIYIFKYDTTGASTQNYTLTIYDGTDVVLTDTATSLAAGGHYFFIDVMAGSHGAGTTSGAVTTAGLYSTTDFDAGTYTYTVTGDTDGLVYLVGSFEIK